MAERFSLARTGLSLPGMSLPGAASPWLGYRTWGALNPAGDNAILLPCYYTGTSDSYEAMIAPGRALDPERFFIVAVDLFGNGRSTSPSHCTTPALRAAFAPVSLADNVRAQFYLARALGIRRFALVYGWSMGAMQAWFWAAMYPEMVEAILPVCGAARCWPQNRVFLEGVRAALTADSVWAGGAYRQPPRAGLKAFGRAYCGWAFSPEFFREEGYRAKGVLSLEAFLTAWEDDHLLWEAADLVSMLDTWATTDIGALGAGWQAVLAGIRARVIAMPCDQDRYFTLEENAIELASVRGAELRPLQSALGHCAGAPGRWAEPTALVEAAIRELTAVS